MDCPIQWLGPTDENNATEDPKYKRTKFDKDYGTIIYLSEFRKIHDKTQVYSTNKGSARNRLAHSLEVYNVALQLWREIYYSILKDTLNFEEVETTRPKNDPYWVRYNRGISIEKLLECCCLAHDIGHPPFAHAAEKGLQENPSLKRKFDSNKQNLRILSKIGTIGKINNSDVSSALLDSLLKSKPTGPFTSDAFNIEESDKIKSISIINGTYIELTNFNEMLSNIKKILNENNEFTKVEELEKFCRNITNNKDYDEKIYIRHPLTYIMTAADDISYISSDIEDALKEHILRRDDLLEQLISIDFEFLDDKYQHEFQNDNEEKNNKIKKIYSDLYSECENLSCYSKIKTYIIRFLIKKCNENIRNAITPIGNEILINFLKNNEKKLTIIDKINPVEYLNCFPIIFLYASLKNFDKDLEFGNFLYFNNKHIKNFKKNIFDCILKSKRVLNDNYLAKHVIENLVDLLKPKNNTEEEIIRISAFLPIEFRKILKDEFKKSPLNSELVIIDYIGHLSPQLLRKDIHAIKFVFSKWGENLKAILTYFPSEKPI